MPDSTTTAGGHTAAVRAPYDRFEHGIKGLAPLTRRPLDVNAEQAEQLRTLAGAHRVPVVITATEKES